MGDLQCCRQIVAGEPCIPVMTVDELVDEAMHADECHSATYPLLDRAKQILLWNKLFAAAGNPDNPHMRLDFFDLLLVLEPPRPDVDIVAERRQPARELQHIHYLSSGIGRAERRLRCHIAMYADHRDSCAFP